MKLNMVVSKFLVLSGLLGYDFILHISHLWIIQKFLPSIISSLENRSFHTCCHVLAFVLLISVLTATDILLTLSLILDSLIGNADGVWQTGLHVGQLFVLLITTFVIYDFDL